MRAAHRAPGGGGPAARPARAALSLRAPLCVRRAVTRRAGAGPPRPLQGERPGAAARVAGTPSWAARCGARAATGGPRRRPWRRPAGRAAPPASPAPPAPARSPARAHTRTPSQAQPVITICSGKSEVRSGRGRGEPPAPPRNPEPAPPAAAPMGPPGTRDPRGLPGVRADSCCWRGFAPSQR